MYMKYDTCLNSSSVDAILVVFADLFTKKVNKPSLVRSPEILLRASSSCEFRGSTTRLVE